MPTLSRIVPFVLLFPIACADDPAGPGGDGNSQGVHVDVDLTSTQIAPASEAPGVRCEFDMVFRAERGARAPIYAESLTFHVFAGEDRGEPVDSIVFDGDDMSQLFGFDEIEAGERVETSWFFSAVVPIGIEGTFRFRDRDLEDGVATFAFDCGPVLDENDPAAPPAVTSVTVFPQAGTVEAGSPVRIDLEAASDLGLWETWVITATPGSIDTLFFYEALAHETERSVLVDFPSDAPLGTQMSVRVVVFDGALRSATSAALLSAPYTDTQAPTGTMFVIGSAGEPCTVTTCQHAAGSDFFVNVHATDPSGLGWTYVRFGDPVTHVDSISSDGGDGIQVPVVPGVYPMSGRMTDRHGNGRDVALPGLVNVFELHDPSSHELDIGRDARVYPDFATDRLFVLDSAGAATGYALPGLAALGPLVLAGRASSVDFGDAGTVVAALPEAHAIQLVGSATRTIPITAVDSADGLATGDVALAANGRVLVALSRGAAGDLTTYLVEVDTATGSQRVLLGPSAGLFQLRRSADAQRIGVFSGCDRIYDSATASLGACATVVGVAQSDADGSRWVSGCELYDATLAPVGTIPRCDDSSLFAAPAATEGTAWIGSVDIDRGLESVDYATGLVLEQQRVWLPYGSIVADPSGELIVGVGATDARRWLTVVELE